MPIDTVSNPIAESFREMAAAVERNPDSNFGGAFVVVPPKEGGEALATLVLDNKQDPAQFWQMLLTKCQMMIAGLDNKQRQSAFGGRR